MSFLKRVMGDPNERELKRIRPIVEAINSLEEDIEGLSDDDLRARTAEFRTQLDQCENQDEQDAILGEILPEAFAMVREASRRAIGMRHYDVQLIGGIVLHQGKIAEMRTGEGKTLVATLPSYLNALTGRGVHVITVNDYLAQRDASWMGRVHNFLGLTVGCILSGPEHQNPVAKRAGYAADITYGTNNEFGFDYLRDNMVSSLEHCVQRQLNYGIVDEVDNILIDEARTPLIISAPTNDAADMYVRFARVMPILKELTDYEVDAKTRTVAINDSGIDKIEAALGIKDIYADMDLTRYLENALKAQAAMQRDKDYIVRDGEVIIVDEHTGRQMVGRRYNEGLHQAIEAKENVRVQNENRTVATITFQNYFRIYRKLSGMTGTALTEAQEFDKIYKLDVMVIPPHRPMVRRDNTDLIYMTEDAKYNAVVEEILTLHEKGVPVLVGTTSVEHSEQLAQRLERTEVPFEILNAKNHLREASIIAQAGRSGAITISTNMAGRGTDILLGGNPEGMIENILRQWDIDADVATEEDMAEALAEAKRICDEDRDRVLAEGGLHVIGTERHDSRRIDNQLRGRAGRQGDPGSTRFYISLQDDLMVRFGAERVSGMMKMLKVDEEAIENNLISKMIEGAQQKVEAYYFDIRKNVVEYDDVIAKQREVIYSDRRAILEGKDLHDRVRSMVEEEVTSVVTPALSGNMPENWDLDAIANFYDHWHMPVADDFFPENLNNLKRKEFVQQCIDWALERYEEKWDGLRETLGAMGGDVAQIDSLRLYVERDRLLNVVDSLWMDHIDSIDELRSGIGLRGIAQTDPLVEFKREAFKSFGELKTRIRHYVAENIMLSQVQIGLQPPPPALEEPTNLLTNESQIEEAIGEQPEVPSIVPIAPPQIKKPALPKRPLTQTKAQGNNKKSSTPSRPLNGNKSATPSRPLNGNQSTTPSRPLSAGASNGNVTNQQGSLSAAKIVATKPTSAPVVIPRVGPNEPCPCGSKQKYKFCHGLTAK